MRIGILTSGGDAPGMNAAVRAVARTAFSGVGRSWGYGPGTGALLEGRIYPMDRRPSRASSTVGAPCWGRNARLSLRRPRGRGVRRASSPRPRSRDSWS